MRSLNAIIATLVALLAVGALSLLGKHLTVTGWVLTVDVDPVLIHVGPAAISWYGLAVGTAMFVGVWLTLREARRKGLEVDAVTDLTLWAILGGLVGARLFHAVDRWDYYAANPLQIFAIHNGGLAILGGIIGGALAVGIGARRRGMSVRRLFDAAAPGLVLGQAIGRFGCLVTGDTLGRPTDGSWGVIYLNPGAMAPQLGVAYQPVFLYEQTWDVAVFVILLVARRRLIADGHVFAVYLGLYAVGKFMLTFFRTEAVWVWGLQEAQILAIGMLIAAIAVAGWRLTGRLGVGSTQF